LDLVVHRDGDGEWGWGYKMTTKLECSKKLIISVEYSELERFIKQNYGHEYNIADREERDNDTKFTIYVEKEDIGCVREDNIKKFRETGEGKFILQDLMLDMLRNELIDEGDYLVNICW